MYFIMKTWKIIQRQTYDILSHKYSLLVIIVAFTTILVSVIQFGEILLSWSQDKYESVFNSFTDNIGQRSYQHALCQSVPVDVVYTWVNGTDPVLLDNLRQYRDKLRQETSRRCPYRDCVPSTFAALRGHSTDVSDATLRNVQVSAQNWTLLAFNDQESAAQAYSRAAVGEQAPSHAHWTSDGTAPNLYTTGDSLMLVGLPWRDGQVTDDDVRAVFPESGVNVDRHQAKGVLVVTNPGVDMVVTKKIVSLSGVKFRVHRAHLILELPSGGHPSDLSMSRFEDKDELRYSLRSLERFAPWVRHVYVVTNGQIPHWLDLENPRLTVVTHRDIFPDPSHLPTFSSPAIESHLHRIPGLSSQFLYLNDDVLLGREVWPEDFITHATGQKVYLSWGVPDCSTACPWAWVGDGSCDPPCNTSACFYDNGDCLDSASNEDMLEQGDQPRYQHNIGEEEPYQPNSRRNKLDDNFLDNAEYADNNLFADNDYAHRPEAKEEPVVKSETAVVTESVGILENTLDNNVERLIRPVRNNSVVERESKVLRSRSILQINEQFYISNLLNSTKVSVNTSSKVPSEHLNNSSVIDNVPYTIFSNETGEADIVSLLFPSQHNSSRDIMSSLMETYNTSDLPKTLFNDNLVQAYLKSRQQLRSKYRLRGYKVRDPALIPGDILEEVEQRHDEKESQGSKKKKDALKRKMEEDTRNSVVGKHQPVLPRKPLDTFAESLLYVNQLFNQEYGFKSRKVPAHMPHLVDKHVMGQLQQRFSSEWFVTSSHRMRSSRDMQFAFSYFYFLMSEKVNRSLAQIFNTFDTDQSRTWSDRELRTLLTRIYELPLGYNRVLHFEQLLLNCSKHLPPDTSVVAPPFERYHDSKLPTITESLITACQPIAALLTDKLGTQSKYKYELVKDRAADVSFKMLGSNLSQLVVTLDDIRRAPKKFICLNDNLDPSREADNVVARAVLQDLYDSLFPKASSFELPYDLRNRFLHVDELVAWRDNRDRVRSVIYVCLAALAVFTLANFVHFECRWLRRKLFKRKSVPVALEEV